MVKKVVLGLVEGALLGGVVAVALSRLHAGWGPLVAYAATAFVGALVGAVAGKPIWARAAKLEGLLKSLAGAFIAATALYGARKWLNGVHVDFEALGGGAGPIGQVPSAALPIIGASLGFVFQIDDALGGDSEPPRRRVVEASPESAEQTDVEDDERSERRARGER